MEINIGKTKVMAISRTHENVNIKINNQNIEQVEKFVYLGSNITENNIYLEDVKRRLSIARQKFSKLQKIWKNKNISDRLKIILFKALIIPIATYGSETWTMTQSKINWKRLKCHVSDQ